MKKHKSKSNINIPLKQQQKDTPFPSFKGKKQQENQNKQKLKIPMQKKSCKNLVKETGKNKATNLKTKLNFESNSHHASKPEQTNQHQFMFCKQRRNSASIVSQRPTSRISNKRCSVISTKSNKHLRDQKLKENDQNQRNLQDMQNFQNQQIFNELKKTMKTTKNKKKLSLNINPKIKDENKKEKQQHNKCQMSGRIKEFQKKMSKYLNEKDIFSKHFVKQKDIEKKKSIKKLKSNSKQMNEHNIQKGKDNKKNERDNLLSIYQFYKKTFDINFNSCMKKSTNPSRANESKQICSKSSIRPSCSSTINQKNQNSTKGFDSKIHENSKKNNQSNSSRNKSRQSLSKSRKTIQIFIGQKENRILSQIQKSSLIDSRLKSRNSMVFSQTSVKDNILSHHVEKECNESTKDVILNPSKQKKSYKQLIVYNENFSLKDSKNTSNFFKSQKNTINEKSNLINPQTHKIAQSTEKLPLKEKQIQQGFDLKKIEIGSSNIDVLKWWSNQKKQEQGAIDKDESNIFKEGVKTHEQRLIETRDKIIEIQHQQKFQPTLIQKEPGTISEIDITRSPQNRSPKNESKKYQQSPSKVIHKVKQESLQDLSSISLIHDPKNELSNQKYVGLKIMSNIGFEFEEPQIDL